MFASNAGAHEEIIAGVNLLQNDDKTSYRMNGYRAGGEWLRRDTHGQMQLLDMKTQSPVLLARFQPGREPYSTILGACGKWARASEERIPWGERGRQLPALRIVYEGGCADNTLAEELYLENIGLVRRIVNKFAGPVQYELIRARAGSFVSASGLRASFEVSLPSTRLVTEEGKASTSITLHPASRRADPLTLEFRNSQRFDLAPRNASSKKVGRCSEGRVFNPATARFQVVDRSWTETITIPGLAPGFFPLTATLANSNPGQFAATIPVRIG